MTPPAALNAVKIINRTLVGEWGSEKDTGWS